MSILALAAGIINGASEGPVTPIVALAPAYSSSDAQLTPTIAVAGFELANTGLVYTYSHGDQSADGTWIAPQDAAGNDYEARFTLDSGDTPSGTLNTWLGLGTTRGLILQTDGIGVQSLSSSLTIEIRDAGTMAVLASSSVLLTAEEVN